MLKNFDDVKGVLSWVAQAAIILGSAYAATNPKLYWLAGGLTALNGQMPAVVGPSVTPKVLGIALALGLMLGPGVTEAQAVCDTANLPTSSVCGPTNTASWTAPTTNTDNTPLNDFATWRIVFGPASPICTSTGLPVTGATVRNLGALGVPPAPLVNTTVTTSLGALNMPNGLTFIGIQAVDVVGNASVCSPPVQFTFNGNIPNTGTNFKAGP
jgi:hypothetical protein